MLKIDLSRSSIKFLNSLPEKQANQISKKLSFLLENPYPHDAIKLKGYPYYRAKIGEYRIIYNVDVSFLKVFIIDKRNDDEIYRKLIRKH